MIKIRSIKYYFLIAVIFSFLSSCVTTNRIKQIVLLPVDGVIPGVTLVEDVKLRGERGTGIDSRTGEQVKQYKLDSSDAWYEDDLITFLSIYPKKHPIPDHWKEIGLSWNSSFHEWFSIFSELGYTIKVTKSPTYKMKDKFCLLTASFEAWHPEESYISYKILFSNASRNGGSYLKDKLYNVNIRYHEQKYFRPFVESILIPSYEPITFSEDKRKAIALSGLLGSVNNSYQERLEDNENTEENRKKWEEILSRDWGIESRDDLLKMLGNLMNGGHSSAYLELLTIIKDNPETNILEYASNHRFENYKTQRLIFVNKMKDLPGNESRSLHAWDLGRCISISRWGYLVGYLTEDEAWERIEKYQKLIEEQYSSWEDYAANYTLGRMFWAAGFGGIQEKGNQISSVYSELIRTENSVWRTPWGSSAYQKSKNQAELEFQDIMYLTTSVDIGWNSFKDGIQFYNAKLFEKARDQFLIAIKEQPDFYHLLIYLGFSERNLNNIKGATSYFKDYYNEYSGDYFATLYYGEALEDNGNTEEALFILNKALEIDTNAPYVYKSLARIYISFKNFNEAAIVMDNTKD